MKVCATMPSFFFPFKYLFLSSMYVFCLHVCIYMHVYLVSAYMRRRFPGSAVADGCEPPCGFWELSSGPSQEQVVLTAERSLQPQFSPSTMWATGIKLGPSGLPASCSTSAPSHLSSQIMCVVSIPPLFWDWNPHGLMYIKPVLCP